MPPGRPPLDPEVKAKRRKETLQRYAAKNRESLRAAAKPRMQAVRRRTPKTTAEDAPSEARIRARASAARYRERHRELIRAADTLRRAQSYVTDNGCEAFDEKQQRSHMSKTQKKHEGRPPPPRPRAAHLVAPRRRFNPKEVLTENQKRCRALRADGFEEDNGDDSDEDVPPGMCGCDCTECQLMHKNETMNRKEWKLFHLKYANELETR